MILLRVFLLSALLFPALAHADYTTATVHVREQLPTGLVKFTIRFSGDAGEELKFREYTMVPAATAIETNQALRRWVQSVLTQLNLSVLAADAAILAPGSTITPLAPLAPTVSAKNIWRHKVNLYDQLQGKGYTGALGSAVTALKADIEATYNSTYLEP